jgi:hypothetical protein
MSCIYLRYSFIFEINYENISVMKEIFGSITGMLIVAVIYLIFSALISLRVQELIPIFSFIKGFVFITLLMGIVIFSRSAIQLLKSCCFRS